MTNTIEVRECCYVCELGHTTSESEVFCYRTPLCNKIDNTMDYLDHCNHFKVMQELQS